MKKTLLIGACALMGLTAAQALPTAPKTLPTQSITNISPDGRFIVAQDYGNVIITDLVNDKTYEFYADDASNTSYGAGLGNTFSNTGIMVGNTSTTGDPAYWDASDGEWHLLPNPDGRPIWLTGINLDGTVIVGGGNVIPADNAPEGLLLLPMVWTKGDDGKWSEPVILPHPEIDFSGRTMQYIYAHVVSADGKTIFGHTQDYSGTMNFPILYTKDAEGKWSYKEIATDLINPNHITLPEFREDGPTPIEPTDYMTAEQKKSYEDAVKIYQDSQYDENLYPDPLDYMTDENRAKYDDDLVAYYKEAEEYNAWIEEYYTLFDKMRDDSPKFVMNSIFMNAAGTLGMMSQDRSVLVDPTDPWSEIIPYNNPFTFDFVTGENKPEIVDGIDVFYPSYMTSDGTLLGYAGSLQEKAMMKLPGADWVPLYDFIKANADEETCNWMKENILHTFDFPNPSTGETMSFVDEPMLGKPCASDDLKTFASYMENWWGTNYDDPDYAYSYGYVIPAVNATSVKGVNAENALSLKALRGGIIVLSEAADVEVYDLQGRRVFSAKGINGNIATGLECGIYTVKATNGTDAKVLKVRF